MSKQHDPDINYRKHPEKYRIGSGEQGVLTIEPYKSELLPQTIQETRKLRSLMKKSSDLPISLRNYGRRQWITRIIKN